MIESPYMRLGFVIGPVIRCPKQPAPSRQETELGVSAVETSRCCVRVAALNVVALGIRRNVGTDGRIRPLFFPQQKTTCGAASSLRSN
jgi:hypothetical protein